MKTNNPDLDQSLSAESLQLSASADSVAESASRSTPGQGSGYIPTLDGWRAVAILAVIFHHATLPLVGRHPMLQFSEQGAMGVDVFFALSGFLICSRLLEEKAKHGFINIRDFYLRRVFRILPPYLTYLAVLLVMALFGLGSLHAGEWLSCLTFTRNYLPRELWTWKTGHFWSLSVEEHFYLIFPGVLVLLGAVRLRRWLPLFIVIATAWRMVDYRYQLFERILPGVPFPFRSDIRIDGIAMGALAALIVAVPKVRNAIRQRLTSGWLLGLAAVLLVTTFASIPMSVFWQRALIAVAIMSTALRSSLWVARWLELPWLRWIGRLSYSLYIWQQIFFVPSENPIGRWMAKLPLVGRLILNNPDREWMAMLPLLCVGTVVMALLSYHFVEQPALKLGRRLLMSRRQTAVEPQTNSALVTLAPSA